MKQSRRSSHIAEPDWLFDNLDNPNIRIVDMSGFVKVETDESGNQRAEYLGAMDVYEDGHIPGAVYLDWTRDIVDGDNPVPVQIASEAKFTEAMDRSRISNQTQVIAYDNHPSMQFATRLWWALRYFGHENVMVLNGGIKGWVGNGYSLTTENPKFESGKFVPHINSNWLTNAELVVDALADPANVILDARDAAQFHGKTRRGPRGGHIPGAVNVCRESLVGSDGRFLPDLELLDTLVHAGVSDAKRVIAYCNGGVAATSVLFACSLVGFDHLSNYDGSWNEWSYRQDLPIEP